MRWPGGSARAGRSAGPCGAAALTIADGQRLALLEEAVSVLEHSPARLELAHALADLGAELNRRNRRREGRETERTAIKLARDCGAVVLAESAQESCTPDPDGVHGPS